MGELGGPPLLKKKKRAGGVLDGTGWCVMAERQARASGVQHAYRVVGQLAIRQVTVRQLHCLFSSRRRHTRLQGDWSSDVCSSDLGADSTCCVVVHVESELICGECPF